MDVVHKGTAPDAFVSTTTQPSTQTNTAYNTVNPTSQPSPIVSNTTTKTLKCTEKNDVLVIHLKIEPESVMELVQLNLTAGEVKVKETIPGVNVGDIEIEPAKVFNYVATFTPKRNYTEYFMIPPYSKQGYYIIQVIPIKNTSNIYTHK
jgi:hypothetical protein